MTIEWLEPSIEKRTAEILDRLFQDELNGPYQDYLKTIESTPGITQELAFELENLFVLMIRKRIDISYRAGLMAGLSDGMSTKV